MTSIFERINTQIDPQQNTCTFASQKIRREVERFVKSTSDLAQRILYKDQDSSHSEGESRVIVHEHYSPWYCPLWTPHYYQPVYAIPHSREDSRRKK